MFFEEMCKVMEDLREESFAEGRAEGQTEGRREQAQMTARNLSVQGLSAEQIAQAVGFSVEAVKEWLAQKNVCKGQTTRLSLNPFLVHT